MLLFVLAYVGGVLTILSPCILPVLPFVFARADRSFVSHGLPMLAGMAIAFAAIASLAAVGGGWAVAANQGARDVAFALLALFGVALMFPAIGPRFGAPLATLGERLSGATGPGRAGSRGIAEAVLLGAGTGLLRAPCAGPILGLILAGATISGVSVRTTLLLLTYASGACTSLALALLAGRQMLARLRATLATTERLRRVAGGVVLLGVLAIASGTDAGALRRVSWPAVGQLEERFAGHWQQRPPVAPMDADDSARAMPAVFVTSAQAGLPVEGVMPTLDGATEWIGSPPLSASTLRGKVVLVDFWTYSCINCLRTLPYLRAWAEKYREQGLVVIGVHSPEFAFERNSANVRRALHDLHIDYPVAVDSNYAIWRAFDNDYWPALYFVDAQGRIRHHQFGEGGYDRSEAVLRELLAESGHVPPTARRVAPVGEGTQAAPGPDLPRSGETYLGYRQAQGFVSPDRLLRDQARDYRPAQALGLNEWTLSGRWTEVGDGAVLAQAGGRIAYRFEARDLHLVLGPAPDGRPVRFRVRVDGLPPLGDHGADVDPQGDGVVDTHRLYQLVRQAGGGGERLFEIEFLDPNVEAYVFTFG